MYKIPTNKLILLRVMAVAIILVCVISTFVAGVFVVYCRTRVNGMSMYPTYNEQYTQTLKRDIVYINRFARVKRQDVVVLDLTKNSNFNGYAIKRLVAVEGDVVNMQFDSQNMQYNLIVNGQIVDFRKHNGHINQTYSNFDSYLKSVDVSKKNDQGLIIGKGEIFVLGDNWLDSKDSALIGPLKYKDIIGKVDFSISPGQNEVVQVLKHIF